MRLAFVTTATSVRTVLWGMVAFSFGLAGCGDGGPELAAVTGTVTRDGQPVPNMRVVFQPTSGRPSTGQTNQDGSYTLHYTGDDEGAVLGQHKVQILTAPDPLPPGFEGERMVKPETDAVNWPDPVTIESGENTIDFDLPTIKKVAKQVRLNKQQMAAGGTSP